MKSRPIELQKDELMFFLLLLAVSILRLGILQKYRADETKGKKATTRRRINSSNDEYLTTHQKVRKILVYLL